MSLYDLIKVCCKLHIVIKDIKTFFIQYKVYLKMKPKNGESSFISLIIFLLLIIISNSSYSQQTIFPQPLSDRIANYDMNVKLDPVMKTVSGEETLFWKNTSNDKINNLEFHLYLNAFKNTNSTFIKESGGQLRGDKFNTQSKLNWGWENILSMKVKDGEDLTNKIKFIHPDDDNADDQTVISVPLEKPVLPGKEITLNIKFISKLPKVFARSGFSDNFFMVGQWFPKIGVYEKAGERYAVKGQWNCHQYHANSEFYADFGVYNVHITVPENFVVGAVGILQSEKENNDSTKTLFYHAEDVIDFAWTASPLFKVVNAEWRHVKIRVLLQPQHLEQADRHINSVSDALEYFTKYLGDYPYPNLTIVDPPFRAFGAAGMEYPTLFTAGCLWGIPRGVNFTENVVIHEFGHNYFMGMLATNEFEEAWMDEGFNTYYETRIMDHYYGKNKSFFNLFGFHFGDFEQQRETYAGMSDPNIYPAYQNSWDFKDGGYGSITYSKTATWMKTLQGLVGDEVMNEIMKTYFERWKFKHPCGSDFINIVNEVVKKRLGNKFGDNMDWFFDEVLYGTDVCDYKLAYIIVSKIQTVSGAYDSSGVELFYKSNKKNENKDLYRSKVVIERLGGVIMPEEILVHFNSGKEVLEQWDGKDRVHNLIYERPDKAVWAKIDPYNKIPLDVNLINNSYTVKPEKTAINKYAAKFIFWIENTMQTFGMLF